MKLLFWKTLFWQKKTQAMMQWRWKIAQAAEIRWWQRYLKNKKKADYLHWKKEYWQNFLKECQIELPAKANCLDAGCGPAGIFIILDDQKVTALDPLLDAYKEKIDHFAAADYPNVSFQNRSLEELAQEASYDYIFCLNAINHVQDIDLALDKLWGALKSGGSLILSIDAHNYKLFKHIFRLIPGDILHPHQYDLQEYEAMILKRDGEVLRTKRIKSGFWFDYYVLIAKKIISPSIAST